jgi:hypothetical protein
MFYDVWIDRVRWCVSEVTIDDFSCKHCGTKFWGAAASGRHATTCGQRRSAQGLMLNLNLPPARHFHQIAPDMR